MALPFSFFEHILFVFRGKSQCWPSYEHTKKSSNNISTYAFLVHLYYPTDHSTKKLYHKKNPIKGRVEAQLAYFFINLSIKKKTYRKQLMGLKDRSCNPVLTWATPVTWTMTPNLVKTCGLLMTSVMSWSGIRITLWAPGKTRATPPGMTLGLFP